PPPHIHTSLSPPFGYPLVVQHRRHTAFLQDFDSRRIAIRFAIEHVRDARIDDQLGAHHTGRRTHEHHLVPDVSRRLHQRVHLGVNTPAITRDGRVALIRQATRVAVVPDRQNVFQQLIGYHGPDL